MYNRRIFSVVCRSIQSKPTGALRSIEAPGMLPQRIRTTPTTELEEYGVEAILPYSERLRIDHSLDALHTCEETCAVTPSASHNYRGC